MLFVIAISIIGVVLLVVGLRGRRIDDHPLCAKCKFDLHGLVGPQRCTECGAALDHPRAVRIGHRRRSPIMIGLGSLGAGFTLSLLGFTIWSVASGTNLDPYKPTWMLELQVKHGLFGSRDSAVVEMVSRVMARNLPPEKIEWILLDGLGMRIDTRAQIRTGEPWPYSIDFKVKNISGVSLYFFADQIDIGPHSIPAGTGYFGSGGVGGRHSSSAHVGPIPPGTYEATLRFWFALAPGPTTAPPPIGKVTLEFPRRLDILPVDTATPIGDESLRSSMLEAIQIAPSYANSFTQPAVNFGIDIKRPPMSVAFDVFVRQSGADWRVGSVTCVKGDDKTWGLMQEMPADFKPDLETMFIVLHPSVKAAQGHVDIVEFWDGEIVLPVKDVKHNVPR